MKSFKQERTDILQVHKILINANVVSEFSPQVIAAFFHGDKQSTLYNKFAHLHQNLWGKYRYIRPKDIELIIGDSLIPLPHPKYALFHNVARAKKFTEAELERIKNGYHHFSQRQDASLFKETMIDGHQARFNTEGEWLTYQKLSKTNLIKVFRTQNLVIPYVISHKKIYPYVPSFVFLTPEGYLAIVESKPVSVMSSIFVRAKYFALKQYCATRGYMYAMINEDMQTIEMINDDFEENEVTEYVQHLLAMTGQFGNVAFQFVLDKFPDLPIMDIKKVISQFFIRHDLINCSTNDFQVNNLNHIDFHFLNNELSQISEHIIWTDPKDLSDC